MLLKAIAKDEVLARSRHVLDAGCGTGVIGLSVAKAFSHTEVVMRDRDLLAVAFSDRNREQNRLGGITAWTDPLTGEIRKQVAAPVSFPGLLADGCEGGPYDFILSNLPAKAGVPVLEAFFRNCSGQSLLVPGGRVAVVIVNTLADAASKWISTAGLALVKSEKGGGHTVFVAEKPVGENNDYGAGQPEETRFKPKVRDFFLPCDNSFSELDLYVRRTGNLKVGTREFNARGYWGLPDFDTVSHATDLAAEVMNRTIAGSLVRECLIVNPGVGHLALWLSKVFGPKTIRLASRDSLALLASRDNLSRSGRSSADCPLHSSLELDELINNSIDLAVWNPDLIPDYDWIEPIWTSAARLCKKGACLVVVSTPTELVRLEKRKTVGWRMLADKRKKGMAVMVFRRE